VDPKDKAIFLRDKLKDQPGFNFPLLSDADHKVIDRYVQRGPRVLVTACSRTPITR